MADSKKPIIGTRKVFAQGSSAYISLPPEWFRAHNIKMPEKGKPIELVIVADCDIRIVNPKKSPKIYDEVTKIVSKAPKLESKKVK